MFYNNMEKIEENNNLKNEFQPITNFQPNGTFDFCWVYLFALTCQKNPLDYEPLFTQQKIAYLGNLTFHGQSPFLKVV